MKVYCTCICLLFLTSPAIAADNMNNIKIIENVQTYAALNFIKKNPAWLFSDDKCPADLIPDHEIAFKNKFEECKNKHIDCLEACKAGAANHCFAMALIFQQDQTHNTYSENLYLKSCKLGLISGCTNRATGIMDASPNNAQALKCASDTFKKGCQKHDPWACTMFGFNLSKGIGIHKNLGLALKILPKGCRFGNDDPACQFARKIIQDIKEQLGG